MVHARDATSWMLLALGALAGVACQRHPAADAAVKTQSNRVSNSSIQAPRAKMVQQPRVQPNDAATAGMHCPAAPGPVLIYGRFPDAEEDTTFTLRRANRRPIPIYATPGGKTRVVGQLVGKRGDPTDVLQTAMWVTKPRPIVAVGDITLEARRYDCQTGRVDDATVTVQVARGDTVHYYQYAGEGDCYVSHKGAYYVTNCSVSEQLNTVQTPIAERWWVQVEQGEVRGWIEVDARLVSTTRAVD